MRPRIPLAINIAFIAAGALAIGGKAADLAVRTPTEGAGVSTITLPGSTSTATRLVKSVVHGRIIHENERVYVYVPVLVIHTDNHRITVPAHKIPIRNAAVTKANPLVTVYVPLPGETVYVPTTVTTTELVPTTLTDTITTTVSLPIIPTTSDQE